MQFERPLIPAFFLRRYKRFLADVRMHDGTQVTVHCANTGSMLGLLEANRPCLLSQQSSPNRRYSYSLEALLVGGEWVGAYPLRANQIAREAFETGMIPELSELSSIRSEVAYGTNSRADWVLQTHHGETWFVEVKSASMQERGVSMFPDAVTLRGRKHLEELREEAKRGAKALMLFVATRDDVSSFRPASHIDPAYAMMLREVAREGVLVRAIRSRIDCNQYVPRQLIPVELG